MNLHTLGIEHKTSKLDVFLTFKVKLTAPLGSVFPGNGVPIMNN